MCRCGDQLTIQWPRFDSWTLRKSVSLVSYTPSYGESPAIEMLFDWHCIKIMYSTAGMLFAKGFMASVWGHRQGAYLSSGSGWRAVPGLRSVGCSRDSSVLFKGIERVRGVSALKPRHLCKPLVIHSRSHTDNILGTLRVAQTLTWTGLN